MSDTTGPAFPRSGKDQPTGLSDYPENGMTLRQWYAGQALSGCIKEAGKTLTKNVKLVDIAQKAFKIADAMIEEGNK